MRSEEINGKKYVVTKMTKKISIDDGGAVTPYTLETVERIDGTDIYKATYKSQYGEKVYRLTTLEQ